MRGGEFRMFLLCSLEPLSHLFIFGFVAFAFGVKSKNIIAKTNVKELTTCVFLGILWFPVFNPFWVNFFFWHLPREILFIYLFFLFILFIYFLNFILFLNFT